MGLAHRRPTVSDVFVLVELQDFRGGSVQLSRSESAYSCDQYHPRVCGFIASAVAGRVVQVEGFRRRRSGRDGIPYSSARDGVCELHSWPLGDLGSSVHAAGIRRFPWREFRTPVVEAIHPRPYAFRRGGSDEGTCRRVRRSSAAHRSLMAAAVLDRRRAPEPQAVSPNDPWYCTCGSLGRPRPERLRVGGVLLLGIYFVLVCIYPG